MRVFGRYLALQFIVVLSLSNSGCGGGGGDDAKVSTPTFSLNVSSLNFSALSPNAEQPPSQQVNGTVTGAVSGTLYVVIVPSQPAVVGVTNFTITGNSGYANVFVTPPTLLNVGTYTSNILVRACVNDPTCATGELAGSPKVIAVTYDIQRPEIADSVMPHAITAGAAGNVVIRGKALAGTTSANFGSVAATSVEVVSDSEIHATYPSTLAPGRYAVSLNDGSVPFTGAVVAVAPSTLSSASLSYPEVPSAVLSMVYDAERSSVLVAAGFSTPANNKLWRYTYSGGSWSTPTVTSIPNLRDIALSNDGSRLVAITDYSVLELDNTGPVANVLSSHTFPANLSEPNAYMQMIALSNDGLALINTTYANGYFYSYSFSNAGFIQTTFRKRAGDAPYRGVSMATSADGSKILITDNQSSNSVVFIYDATTGKMTRKTIDIAGFLGQPFAIDNSGNRIVGFGYDNTSNYQNYYSKVYDANFSVLGSLPLNTRVVVLNPLGTRAFSLYNDNSIHAYDLTASPVAGMFPEIGTPVTVTSLGAPAQARFFRTAMSPDGRTIFIANYANVIVVPAPH